MEISICNEKQFEVMGRWEDIGIQLDIADEELTAIRTKHTTTVDGHGQSHNYVQAFRDMIRVWVKQVNPPPTWSNFVKALERLNIVQKLADHLRLKYGTCSLNIT
jgi:hypothetical protein